MDQTQLFFFIEKYIFQQEWTLQNRNAWLYLWGVNVLTNSETCWSSELFYTSLISKFSEIMK